MDNLNAFQQKSKRSMLLTVLCILSLIGGGFSIISNVFVVSLWNQIPEIIAANPFAEQFGMNDLIETTFSNDKKPLYVTMLILYIVSIFGVSKIWNLKELGLHFYIGAQVCLLIAPMIWIKPFSFPFFDAIITAIFIWMYVSELKRIKKSGEMENNVMEQQS